MATQEETPPQHPEVFINSRGPDLALVVHLERDLKWNGVSVYVDGGEDSVENRACSGIEESKVALVILSRRYTESSWCLDELVKIKEQVEEGKLLAIPIFFGVDPSQVKGLEGDFGFNLWNHVKRTTEFVKLKIWKEALDFISQISGFVFDEISDNELDFISSIVAHVKIVITRLSEQQEDAYIDSSRSVGLKGMDGARDGILCDTKTDINLKEAQFVQAEAKPRRDDGLNPIKDDNFLGELDFDATCNLHNCVENARLNSANEGKKIENESESSTLVTSDKPPEHKVFINFHKSDLPHSFIGHLVKGFKRKGINVYIDEKMGEEDLGNLFTRIEDSRIVLVIFTSRYTESKRCLNELVKIKELMEASKLLVIPVFYKVELLEVTQLKGDFGVRFWNLWRISRYHHIIKWKEALESVASIKGIYSKEHSTESEFITVIVKNILERISLRDGKITEFPTEKTVKRETYLNDQHLFGMERRMEQMEKKLEFESNETRIIGVVGMPGIGKTTLAMMLYEKWNCKFVSCLPLLGIHKKSKDYGIVWLRKTLLEVLLEEKFSVASDKTTHESVKDKLLDIKILAVLDDVSEKKQLEFLLGELDWIKKGSKIVITTCDKSLLEGFAHDTYVVPEMNYREAFQLFTYHDFDHQICSPTDTFLKLSRMFVDYTQGHPLALNLLGGELRGKDEAHWKHIWVTVTKSFNMMFQDVWRFSTEQLNGKQIDVFLDIVCFFKSEDEYFVRSLLDSGDPDSIDTVSEVRDLANKFLITISNGQVEVNNLLYTYGIDLSSPRWLRLWNYKDIIKELKKMEKSKADDVRGIFLDMSKLRKSIYLDSPTFINMRNLLYLKIYDSNCPRKCKADCNLYFPDGIEFPLEKVRYLHWVKFPLQELPPDFRPENLVDLRLPYSYIERVWEGVKDTPRLKWVDLRHSSKLLDLSALSKAENLQTLNLEGCTSLYELPVEIQNMKSLVFLNLRGCIRLCYLPKMNLISLKTLILSECSNLKEFQLISENVEFLHLDGTAIEGLPPAIQNLQRLVVLNLKNCKMLECLPNCLGKLKFLEELILSGCSRLKNLPAVRHSLQHIQILLLDSTGASEMPSISCFTGFECPASGDISFQSFGSYSTVREWPRCAYGVCSLRRLCLSGNDFVSLQPDIGKLNNLSWLDVKQCKMLTSIPMLPPRLQYFDAHGCDSLERVANPLSLPVLFDHNHATFNFSNCNKLDQDAKDSIISYTRWRSQLMLDELTRYNGGSILEATRTCFPGWEVPAWFSHRAFGPVLKQSLPLHWNDNKFTGIALCAVISFHGYHEQRNRLLVKCNCTFINEDGCRISFSCTVGSRSESNNPPEKSETCHVFIGYTSILDIKKLCKEEEQGCSHTEALFKFQVTDGTEVLKGCEVMKCGFSLVYPTDELWVKSGVRGAPFEANLSRAYSENVAISEIRWETEADCGDKAGSPQPPIANSLVSAAEYGFGSNSSGRERHIRMLDVDSRLPGKPNHHSNDLISMVASSSQAVTQKSHSQVFVSYHGAELRRTFIRHLVSTLTDAGVNVFTDNDKENGIKQLIQLSQRLKESEIALVIFSKTYVESNICLNELVIMDELAKEGKLLVIPVFYNVRSSQVRKLKGKFGRRFKEMKERYKDELEKVLKWETSVKSIAKTIGIDAEVYGEDASLVEATVQAVQGALNKMSEGNSKCPGSVSTVTDPVSENLRVFLCVLFVSVLLMSPLLYGDAYYQSRTYIMSGRLIIDLLPFVLKNFIFLKILLKISFFKNLGIFKRI